MILERVTSSTTQRVALSMPTGRSTIPSVSAGSVKIFHFLKYFFLFYYDQLLGRGGADFDPQGYNLNNLGRVHQTMPYAKYLSSRPFGSLKEGIFKFLLYVHIVKINDTRGGADFDPRAII
jgi:hypothetical protein